MKVNILFSFCGLVSRRGITTGSFIIKISSMTFSFGNHDDLIVIGVET